jgi:hypothetical protein
MVVNRGFSPSLSRDQDPGFRNSISKPISSTGQLELERSTIDDNDALPGKTGLLAHNLTQVLSTSLL